MRDVRPGTARSAHGDRWLPTRIVSRPQTGVQTDLKSSSLLLLSLFYHSTNQPNLCKDMDVLLCISVSALCIFLLPFLSSCIQVLSQFFRERKSKAGNWVLSSLYYQSWLRLGPIDVQAGLTPGAPGEAGAAQGQGPPGWRLRRGAQPGQGIYCASGGRVGRATWSEPGLRA